MRQHWAWFRVGFGPQVNTGRSTLVAYFGEYQRLGPGAMDGERKDEYQRLAASLRQDKVARILNLVNCPLWAGLAAVSTD